MYGRFALYAQILSGFYETGSEVELPQPVDLDAGSQGMVRTEEPLGEAEPVGRGSGGHRGQEGRHRKAYFFQGLFVVAPAEDMRLAGFGFLHHHDAGEFLGLVSPEGGLRGDDFFDIILARHRSQTAVEQRHMIAALRFELSKVTVPAIRQRVVSVPCNVDTGLAQAVADGLGLALPAAQPLALGRRVDCEVETSPSLSLFARPGQDGVTGRRVALLVTNGMDDTGMAALYQSLLDAGAVARHVGARLGTLSPVSGRSMEVEATIETMPSVLWDAMVLVADDVAQAALACDGKLQDFIRDQYRHGKPMLLVGNAAPVLAQLGIPAQLPDGSADPGLLIAEACDDDVTTRFIDALGRHRRFERETDPPKV